MVLKTGKKCIGMKQRVYEKKNLGASAKEIKTIGFKALS